jgi:hypothetical protein
MKETEAARAVLLEVLNALGKEDLKGTQDLFGLFVHTHLGGKPVGWQWIAVANTFYRQVNARIQMVTTHPSKCCVPLRWCFQG